MPFHIQGFSGPEIDIILRTRAQNFKQKKNNETWALELIYHHFHLKSTLASRIYHVENSSIYVESVKFLL